MNKIKEIVDYLDFIIPNPVCELEFNKDYELLIAVMLSAQTTDKRVNSVTKVLFKKYSDLESLSNADVIDIQNIIKPLGTYTKKSKNVVVIAKKLLEDCNGQVPNNREYLETLPGVGRKTTNVVLGMLYEVPCIAVDTHVERVSKRLKLAYQNDDVLTVEKKLLKKFPKNKLCRLHHQLLLFGRYYCTARNPSCKVCGLKKFCREKRD